MTWSFSQQKGRHEAERKVQGQGGRGKIAAGVAKATSRTILTRQHRHRALQPAAVEPVVGIRSLKTCETNPIYPVFRPKTKIMKKNEPNLCKTNPIQTNHLLS